MGQWKVAHRLIERGAYATLWEAAALGLLSQVQLHVDHDEPTADDITSSFWGACHGGQLEAAQYLLDHGANINWIGYDDLTPLDAAQRGEAPHVVTWLRQHGATTATTSR